MHIAPVDIDGIYESDLRWIATLDTIGYDKRGARELLEKIADRQIQLWRHDEGIVLTSLGDDCVWIEGIAGKMTLKGIFAVRNWLLGLKERAGKYHVRTAVNNIRLERIYQRLGFKPVAKIMEA